MLGIMSLLYLFLVELAKQGFYRWSATARLSAHDMDDQVHKRFDI
jgi:hypothetical protein